MYPERSRLSFLQVTTIGASLHTPQVGKTITLQYLSVAFHVFFNESFRYVRELTGLRDAALEFEVEIDGISVNGIDMIKWDDEGKIVEFIGIDSASQGHQLDPSEDGCHAPGEPVAYADA